MLSPASHHTQGLTLDKVVVDVGSGLTFVACSRVCHKTDLLFTPPFTFQRLAALSNSQRLRERHLRLLTRFCTLLSEEWLVVCVSSMCSLGNVLGKRGKFCQDILLCSSIETEYTLGVNTYLKYQ